MSYVYFCNLSIFSIPLFSRTSISSLDNILTDSTSARIWYSSHSAMAVPASSRVSAANFHVAGQFCILCLPLLHLGTFGLQLRLLGKDRLEPFTIVFTNVPTGVHNGRQIFYIFGRYPNDTSSYKAGKNAEYPVIDLVLCHGDFMNAQHD